MSVSVHFMFAIFAAMAARWRGSIKPGTASGDVAFRRHQSQYLRALATRFENCEDGRISLDHMDAATVVGALAYQRADSVRRTLARELASGAKQEERYLEITFDCSQERVN